MTIIVVSAALLVSFAIYWMLPSSRTKNVFLLLLSVCALCMIGPAYAVYYLGMSAVVFAVCSLMKSLPKEKRKPYLVVAIVFLVVNLCFYKLFGSRIIYLDSGIFPEWSGPLFKVPNIIFPIGLSFVTFRLIHYAVETYRDAVPPADFFRFASYVLFFPTFLAGPVERFPKFDSQTSSMNKISFAEVNYGLWRIGRGMVRKFIIADALAVVIMPVLQDPASFPKYAVILSIYGAAVWLYMDFGGYTDMAIGVARLFGYSIMENFNNPFFKKNIALFWRSWHISVYSWIRDYFYLPFFVYKGTKVKMYVGIFLTMLVFMLWHAPTMNFLIAGIYNGIGLIVWRLFQDIKDKSRVLVRITSLKGMGVISTIFTFSYVSFGIGLAFGGRGNDFFIGILKSLLPGLF
ncbi:MAG: MBOAT family O-acyltransferase [Candidatus Omnitrophota bacterium]